MPRFGSIAERRQAAVAALPILVQQRPVRSVLFIAVALGHIAVEYAVQAVRRAVRDVRGD